MALDIYRGPLLERDIRPDGLGWENGSPDGAGELFSSPRLSTNNAKPFYNCTSPEIK